MQLSLQIIFYRNATELRPPFRVLQKRDDDPTLFSKFLISFVFFQSLIGDL